jgi:hypothetical protein
MNQYHDTTFTAEAAEHAEDIVGSGFSRILAKRIR